MENPRLNFHLNSPQIDRYEGYRSMTENQIYLQTPSGLVLMFPLNNILGGLIIAVVGQLYQLQ